MTSLLSAGEGWHRAWNSEGRRPKPERRSKPEYDMIRRAATPLRWCGFGASDLGLLSAFGVWVSNLAAKATQSHLKATTKRVDSQLIGAPMRPQSHSKATPRLPQGCHETSRGRVKPEIGRPKAERRPKTEGRIDSRASLARSRGSGGGREAFQQTPGIGHVTPRKSERGVSRLRMIHSPWGVHSIAKQSAST